MKKIVAFIAFAIISSAFYSCGTEHIIVARPERIKEVITPPPGPAYVWVNYEYRWDEAKWIYVPGHWENAPYANAVWTPGHWHRKSNGYYWIEGHWD